MARATGSPRASRPMILGALLGGVFLTVSGPGLVFVLNALTFFAAAAVAWFMLPACLAAVGHVTRSVWRSLAEGLTFIKQSPPVLGVVLASSAMWVGIAVSDAILIVFVRDTLALPDSMFGYLRTVIGVGSILGALITPWIARRQSVEYHRLLTAVALVGLLFGALALSMSFWDTMLLYVLGCVAATVAENLTVTVLQRVPHDIRGRIVASCNAIDTLGYMVVVTISPWFTDILPVRVVLMMGGVIILIAVPIARLASRMISANAGAGTGSF